MARDRFQLTADALGASARRVQDGEDFHHWARGVLRGVLPHQALLCGQMVRHSGGFTALQRCSVDVPDAYLEPLERPGNNLSTPMLKRLLQAPDQPHFFDPLRDADWGRTHPAWYAHYLQAAWRNSLVLGHVVGVGDDVVLTAATFYNVDPALEAQASDLRRAVMQPLHAALCSWYAASQATGFTKAEEAIASLLKQGKSTKEIAKQLGKSDHTVKHQISAMLRKFEVGSRAELVSGFGGL
ncbi:MAG: response regulator transcription factor [Ferruginibacter sp.]|nr:response regulator transcription factor [Rhodoferax sp.]